MTTIKISTKRTILRVIELADLDAIHALHTLPETDKFNTLGIPKNIGETKSIIKPWIKENESTDTRSYTFAIVGKSDGKFIGLFGLKLGSQNHKRGEVWYKIHSDYWKMGYATEALRAVINFGFDTLGLHRIQAGSAVDNIGSLKVLEKVGMIREGRGRKVLPLKDGWSDNFEYAILETDERK